MPATTKLTVIIPAYNDADGLRKVLDALLPEARAHNWRVTVVNDFSTDHTAQMLQAYTGQVTVITNHRNLGYGASIKRGILQAKTEWIATMDADGQHRLEDLLAMYGMLDEDVDALLGSRTRDSHAPWARRPGKWVLHHAANFLANHPIPDINCGLRIMRRGIMLDLFNITSDRFSFSTSTTIALLQLGCRVRFVPVVVEQRVGKSTVRMLRDGLYTVMLILRLVFLFHPLRVILPVGLGLMALAFAIFCLSLFTDISAPMTILLLFLSGLQIFLIALVADQNSSLRRDTLLQKIRMDQLEDKGQE
ncbi:glycosyltransferase family 2 protein [Desulfovibrio sp. OttesenSCG-928-A18]|nr:glycosyltransferase family 2 protein [Desulfovibrio sp. OttesenSCG-928-A18]